MQGDCEEVRARAPGAFPRAAASEIQPMELPKVDELASFLGKAQFSWIVSGGTATMKGEST